MYKIGLIGYPLSHSFSKKYFDSKFKKQKIDNFSYSLYPIKNIQKIDALISKNKVIGLNVTRPYKTIIIKHLDKIGEIAKKTNSVNTVFFNPKTKTKYGFNTDFMGFQETLRLITKKSTIKALILGSGSVSKTISYCLNKQQIKHLIVSRKPKNNMIEYPYVPEIICNFKLIINTTPLGQYPNIDAFPDIPYELISNQHHCIDLTYNPRKSVFLKKCEHHGAKILNGKLMLKSQAESSWKIWNQLILKYNV